VFWSSPRSSDSWVSLALF